jgi:hypothetical protein
VHPVQFGPSIRQAVQRSNVSPSAAVKLLRCYPESGGSAPAGQHPGRQDHPPMPEQCRLRDQVRHLCLVLLPARTEPSGSRINENVY